MYFYFSSHWRSPTNLVPFPSSIMTATQSCRASFTLEQGDQKWQQKFLIYFITRVLYLNSYVQQRSGPENVGHWISLTLLQPKTVWYSNGIWNQAIWLPTSFDHSNTWLVWYSDPHCIQMVTVVIVSSIHRVLWYTK